MTIALETLQDTSYKTIIKATLTSTHAAEKILDISTLGGYVSTALSRTNLSAVSWSVSTPIELIWTGSTTAKTAIHLNGNGIYGGSTGMAAIANNAVGGADVGDLVVTSAAASVGFVVVVCHKVPTAAGTGWIGVDTPS